MVMFSGVRRRLVLGRSGESRYLAKVPLTRRASLGALCRATIEKE
jgi:hypothetical protein